MSMTSTFSYQQNRHENGCCRCDLIGPIDANADTVLQTLAGEMPAGSHILLDFSRVERVNSMGLSLLLKIFEEWERQKIRIEVQNLDRMVSMLFKITGLGRFIKSNSKNADADVGMVPTAPTRVVKEAKTITSAPTHDRLNFVANFQSGQQLTGWYLLNTYLQRRMKRAIHFEQAVDAPDGQTTDLLFARPFEACCMMTAHDFIPVMRPNHETDEVVILTRADDDRELKDYQGVTVSTASKNSFVYLLGRFLYDENGLDSNQLSFDFVGNEIKALQSLIRKKCDLVFMLKKTYDGLSSFSRNNARKLDESQTDFASHLFCVSPYLQEESRLLAEILADMEQDQQGLQILQDIQIEGWVKPEASELNMLKRVYERYAS